MAAKTTSLIVLSTSGTQSELVPTPLTTKSLIASTRATSVATTMTALEPRATSLVRRYRMNDVLNRSWMSGTFSDRRCATSARRRPGSRARIRSSSLEAACAM